MIHVKSVAVTTGSGHPLLDTNSMCGNLSRSTLLMGLFIASGGVSWLGLLGLESSPSLGGLASVSFYGNNALEGATSLLKFKKKNDQLVFNLVNLQ